MYGASATTTRSFSAAQVRELDPDAVGDLGRIEFAAVELTLCTVWVTASMKVDDPGLAPEPHGRGGAEDLLAAGQVQADLVGLDVDQGGALAGFGAGQVHTGQRGLQKKMDTAGRPQPPAIL